MEKNQNDLENQEILDKKTPVQESENKSKAWMYILGAIALILLFIFIFKPFAGNKTTEENTAAEATQTSTQQEVGELKDKLAQLETQLNNANDKDAIIASKDETIKALAKRCVTVTVKTQEPVKPKENTEVNVRSVMPVNQVDLSASVSRVINNTAVVDKKEEYKKFCVRVGGEFWPHLAINDGETFTDAVDNGLGGFDIILKDRCQSISGDYGLTYDNVLFVKASKLKKFGDSPDAIGPITFGSFKRMTLQGDYYIYKQK